MDTREESLRAGFAGLAEVRPLAGRGRRPSSFRAPMSPTRAPLILVVEDNYDNRVIYRTILQHSGFRVIEAEDGETAVRRAKDEHPDLVVMDISIPGLDGYEATRILKADGATAGIPILAVTAHAMKSDRLRATEAGCDGWLAKPCDPTTVVAEIRKLLPGPGAAEARD